MAPTRTLTFALLAGAWLTLAPASARADAIINFTLNTSGLSSSFDPYTIEFDLTQGDPSNINTVTISSVNLGGGNPLINGSSPTYTGGASGDLSTQVTLTDNPAAIPPGGFFNSFTQQFTVGSQVSFQIHSTTNFVQNVPDEFAVFLFDKNGAFTAADQQADPSNALFMFDIGAGTLLNVQSFDTVSPAASGSVTLPAAEFTVTSTSTVPEPASLLLVGMGVAAAAGYVRRQRRCPK